MIIALLAVCVFVTWTACHIYRRLAIHSQVIDHPNHRSAHEFPTPTGAGVVPVIVFYLALSCAAYAQLVSTHVFLGLLSGILVAGVGLVDDIRPLSWKIRVPAHFISAVWSIFWVGFPVLVIFDLNLDLGLAGEIFGVIALVWLLNIYNFMDGIDGIAAGETVFVCAAAIILSSGREFQDWPLVYLILLAVSSGFLIINWPGAKVFMGDAGSGFLGLMLGIFALAMSDLTVWTWMILLGWFITDACLTILVRLLRGENITESHSMHAYQHLTRTLGNVQTLIVILAVNVLWLLPVALLSEFFPAYGFLLLLLASLPLSVAQFFCGAGQLQPRSGALRHR